MEHVAFADQLRPLRDRLFASLPNHPTLDRRLLQLKYWFVCRQWPTARNDPFTALMLARNADPDAFGQPALADKLTAKAYAAKRGVPYLPA